MLHLHGDLNSASNSLSTDDTDLGTRNSWQNDIRSTDTPASEKQTYEGENVAYQLSGIRIHFQFVQMSACWRNSDFMEEGTHKYVLLLHLNFRWSLSVRVWNGDVVPYVSHVKQSHPSSHTTCVVKRTSLNKLKKQQTKLTDSNTRPYFAMSLSRYLALLIY